MPIRLGFRLLVVIGALLSCHASAQSEREPGIEVVDANMRLDGQIYLLDTRIEYEFSLPVIEALESGVPITLVMELEVERERSYLWNESIAMLTQRFVLQYHALSRQYLVINLNTGVQQSFYNRLSAEFALGELRNLPVLDSKLLDPEEEYLARMQVRLDIEALPSPLRPWAYFSSSWRLTSKWLEWPLISSSD